MEDGAFPLSTEVFQLIRFAEGDVGILQQVGQIHGFVLTLKKKIAKDAMKPFTTPLGILKAFVFMPYLVMSSGGVYNRGYRLSD